jgi:hypothetical protein
LVALVLKLTLAPALVALATVLTRRVGPRAGGLISGLPVVAGPIVLIYAVQHGDAFAHAAAAAGVLGLCSLTASCAAYALVSLRTSAPLALVACWLAFAAGTAVLSGCRPSLALSATLTLVVICAGVALLRQLASETPAVRAQSDLLPWRLLITAGLVLALTAAAGHLSAHLAGLLAPLPIITAVMAGFTHARRGAHAAIELLAALVLALTCYLAFFVVLAALLTHTSDALAFASATAVSLGCWGLLVLAGRGGRLQKNRGAPLT